MRKLWVIAGYTFLEGMRARFFVGAVVVSVVFVIVGALLGFAPYGQVDQLVARIGWGAVFLTGFAVSVLFSVQHMARERDERVLFQLLARPVTRYTYALGKFFGIWALTAAAILGEGFVLTTILQFFGHEEHRWLAEWLVPSIYIIGKCGVLLSFAMLFAVLFSPMVAMVAAVVYYFLGAASHDVFLYVQQLDSIFLQWMGRIMQWLAPQLPAYDATAWVIYGFEVSWVVHLQALAYYGGYGIAALALYVTVFARREFS